MPKKSRRILLVLLEPPLPFGNAASRWYYVLLKELVARGHDVHTFAACSKEEDIEKTKKLFPSDKYKIELDVFPQKSGLSKKIQSLLAPSSFHFSQKLKDRLKKEALKGYDVLHVEQLWAAWAAIPYATKSLINVHHLLSIDLSESQTLSFKENLARKLNFLTEYRLVRKFKNIRSCSPRLAKKMKVWSPSSQFTTVPVGIDSSLYEYIPDEKRENSKTISLIGNMSWYPGQSAAIRLLERLWPEIHKRDPECKLQIVGWSARSVLKKYLNLPNVEVFENVPEIQPYFEKTNVMLYAPARGSGMKIKVLEAMAFGIPIVTTSEGSEGLPAVDGEHMGLCEDDAGLIERTLDLLNDIDQQNRIRQNARQLLESHCGPKPTVDQIEEI